LVVCEAFECVWPGRGMESWCLWREPKVMSTYGIKKDINAIK
jgi:hypothetical protein